MNMRFTRLNLTCPKHFSLCRLALLPPSPVPRAISFLVKVEGSWWAHRASNDKWDIQARTFGSATHNGMRWRYLSSNPFPLWSRNKCISSTRSPCRHAPGWDGARARRERTFRDRCCRANLRQWRSPFQDIDRSRRLPHRQRLVDISTYQECPPQQSVWRPVCWEHIQLRPTYSPGMGKDEMGLKRVKRVGSFSSHLLDVRLEFATEVDWLTRWVLVQHVTKILDDHIAVNEGGKEFQKLASSCASINSRVIVSL